MLHMKELDVIDNQNSSYCKVSSIHLYTSCISFLWNVRIFRCGLSDFMIIAGVFARVPKFVGFL